MKSKLNINRKFNNKILINKKSVEHSFFYNRIMIKGIKKHG